MGRTPRHVLLHEHMMLSEINPSAVGFHLCEAQEESDSQRQKAERWVPWAWRGGARVCNGDRAPWWEGGSPADWDGDGYTAV